MKNPNPGTSTALTGVSVSSSFNAWAVGFYATTSHVPHALIEHWNSVRWKTSLTPALPNSSSFKAVSHIPGGTDASVVGSEAARHRVR